MNHLSQAKQSFNNLWCIYSMGRAKSNPTWNLFGGKSKIQCLLPPIVIPIAQESKCIQIQLEHLSSAIQASYENKSFEKTSENKLEGQCTYISFFLAKAVFFILAEKTSNNAHYARQTEHADPHKKFALASKKGCFTLFDQEQFTLGDCMIPRRLIGSRAFHL